MLVCMAVAMLSCSKDEEENLDVVVGIIGDWEIESSEMLVDGQSLDTYVENAARQAGISIEDYKESFGDVFGDVEGSFKFMEDKKFTGKIEDDAIAGTWSADGKALTLSYDDGDNQEYLVKSLNSTNAILSTKDLEGLAPELKMEFLYHIKKK